MIETPRATPLARTIDLGSVRSADDMALGGRLHPCYREALGRAPGGDQTIRGLPFSLAPRGAGARWLVVDRPVEVDLAGVEATHLVLLHFCDAWRDRSGARPAGTAVGWVVPVGEPLAHVTVARKDGRDIEVDLRRRFEVNEGIIGWGNLAFLSLPHRVERPVDWLGPHPRQSAGRPAPPGDAGAMVVLPGGWGARQTAVSDEIPSPTDELTLWLHAVEVGDAGPQALRSIMLSPIPGEGDGRLIAVAAITAFSGSASPLRWHPRRSLRITGGAGLPIEIDLGLVVRRRPLPLVAPTGEVTGWGVSGALPPEAEEVEVTAAADAMLYLGEQALPLAGLDPVPTLAGDACVSPLDPADRRLRVHVVDVEGSPSAARVRIQARDGRYLPPLGHRDEVNVGLYEDVGAEVMLGGDIYAYVDSTFDIDLPAGGAVLEAVHGPEVAPIRVDIGPAELDQGWLRLRFGQPLRPGPGRWVSGDTHVHFLAPSTALLQARAEAVNAVHLLATQWGDLHTNVTDLGSVTTDASGAHAIWVGSENRQNMLGHIGLVGSRGPILPFASGGPPEARIGGAQALLVADWLERCRAEGGLAIGAHFPLPFVEVAADIAAGLLDALEMQCFDPLLESPSIREWYRYLDAGYRLPIVAGTDKMTAHIPLGQVRTWARLDDDAGLHFAAWAEAVRAGRTFITSGPVLGFTVDGCGIGDELTVDAGARLEVELVARSPQPVISAVELVADGRIVAARSAPAPVTELGIHEIVTVERTGWLAGRSRSPYAIGSAFTSSMAAHTSPVYVEVRGRPRAPVDMGVPLSLIEGTRAWLETLAPVASPRDLHRFAGFLEAADRRLRERHSGAGG